MIPNLKELWSSHSKQGHTPQSLLQLAAGMGGQLEGRVHVSLVFVSHVAGGRTWHRQVLNKYIITEAKYRED